MRNIEIKTDNKWREAEIEDLKKDNIIRVFDCSDHMFGNFEKVLYKCLTDARLKGAPGNYAIEVEIIKPDLGEK